MKSNDEMVIFYISYIHNRLENDSVTSIYLSNVSDMFQHNIWGERYVNVLFSL